MGCVRVQRVPEFPCRSLPKAEKFLHRHAEALRQQFSITSDALTQTVHVHAQNTGTRDRYDQRAQRMNSRCKGAKKKPRVPLVTQPKHSTPRSFDCAEEQKVLDAYSLYPRAAFRACGLGFDRFLGHAKPPCTVLREVQAPSESRIPRSSATKNQSSRWRSPRHRRLGTPASRLC